MDIWMIAQHQRLENQKRQAEIARNHYINDQQFMARAHHQQQAALQHVTPGQQQQQMHHPGQQSHTSNSHPAVGSSAHPSSHAVGGHSSGHSSSHHSSGSHSSGGNLGGHGVSHGTTHGASHGPASNVHGHSLHTDHGGPRPAHMSSGRPPSRGVHHSQHGVQHIGHGPPPSQHAAPLPPPSHHHDQAPHHNAYKRQRLNVDRPDLEQPLHIVTQDTEIKREPIYAPGIEPISPTPTGPTHVNHHDAMVRSSVVIPGGGKLLTAGKPHLEPAGLAPTAVVSGKIRSSAEITKDEIIRNISRLEADISTYEAMMDNLNKKLAQLNENANKTPDDRASTTIEPTASESRPQTLSQRLYINNRSYAEASVKSLPPYYCNRYIPKYNQPSDIPIVHENQRRYKSIYKPQLLLYFKHRKRQSKIRHNMMKKEYDTLLAQWTKKVERAESSKKKGKETKIRDYFEKAFPELRKAREDKERFQRTTNSGQSGGAGGSGSGASGSGRVSGYARSEAEVDQIIEGMNEQEEEERKMHNYAIIPPIILDEKEKRYRFINDNGLLQNPHTYYKESNAAVVWTEVEKEIFREKFLLQQKNFGFIASFLERKSVQDCVQYYYGSKKSVNYKQLLRKQTMKKRNPKKGHKPIEEKVADPPKVEEEKPIPILTPEEKRIAEDRARQQASTSVSSKPVTTTDVTTTGSVVNSSTNSISSASTTTSASTVSTTLASDRITCDNANKSIPSVSSTAASLATTTTVSTTSSTLTATHTTSGTISVVPATGVSSIAGSSSIDIITTGTVPLSTHNNALVSASSTCAYNSALVSKPLSSSVVNQSSTSARDYGLTNKDTPGLSSASASDRDSLVKDIPASVGGAHQCSVCKTHLENTSMSRPLTAQNCYLYGIDEAKLTTDMRVCSGCRCKVNRKRSVHCPVATCKTPKKRVRRLRSLPPKWAELSMQVKEPVISELGLPENITKCCSPCYNRIARRLGNNPNNPSEPLIPCVPESGADNEMGETSRWTEEEMEVARKGLKENGRDWMAISHLGHDNRTTSISESIASTVTAPSDDDITSDEDNVEDNLDGDTSDTASAPSPAAAPLGPAAGSTTVPIHAAGGSGTGVLGGAAPVVSSHVSSTAQGAAIINKDHVVKGLTIDVGKPLDGHHPHAAAQLHPHHVLHPSHGGTGSSGGHIDDATLTPSNPALSASQSSLKSSGGGAGGGADYDSSATLSADEPEIHTPHSYTPSSSATGPTPASAAAGSTTGTNGPVTIGHKRSYDQAGLYDSSHHSGELRSDFVTQDKDATDRMGGGSHATTAGANLAASPGAAAAVAQQQKTGGMQCVRDIINSAIERNLADTSTPPNHHHLDRTQKQSPGSVGPAGSQRVVYNTAQGSRISPLPHDVAAITNHAVTHSPKTGASAGAYKLPNHYPAAQDARYGGEGHMMNSMPPPAHSAASTAPHHRYTSTQQQVDDLRDHHTDRNQATPPALRHGISPYPSERHSQQQPTLPHVAQGRGPGLPPSSHAPHPAIPSQAIGQPPPLIKKANQPQPPAAAASKPASGGGSITQGTPVHVGGGNGGVPGITTSLPVANHIGGGAGAVGVGVSGSISSGIPRFPNPTMHARHAQPNVAAVSSASNAGHQVSGRGSITQGTPIISYEAQARSGVSTSSSGAVRYVGAPGVAAGTGGSGAGGPPPGSTVVYEGPDGSPIYAPASAAGLHVNHQAYPQHSSAAAATPTTRRLSATQEKLYVSGVGGRYSPVPATIAAAVTTTTSNIPAPSSTSPAPQSALSPGSSAIDPYTKSRANLLMDDYKTAQAMRGSPGAATTAAAAMRERRPSNSMSPIQARDGPTPPHRASLISSSSAHSGHHQLPNSGVAYSQAQPRSNVIQGPTASVSGGASAMLNGGGSSGGLSLLAAVTADAPQLDVSKHQSQQQQPHHLHEIAHHNRTYLTSSGSASVGSSNVSSAPADSTSGIHRLPRDKWNEQQRLLYQQQTQPQHQQRFKANKSPHNKISTNGDGHGGGSPSSEKSSGSGTGTRTITFGEHIDQIINNNYTGKQEKEEKDNSQNGDNFALSTAIKQFLANSGSNSGASSDTSMESPRARAVSPVSGINEVSTSLANEVQQGTSSNRSTPALSTAGAVGTSGSTRRSLDSRSPIQQMMSNTVGSTTEDKVSSSTTTQQEAQLTQHRAGYVVQQDKTRQAAASPMTLAQDERQIIKVRIDPPGNSNQTATSTSSGQGVHHPAQQYSHQMSALPSRGVATAAVCSCTSTTTTATITTTAATTFASTLTSSGRYHHQLQAATISTSERRSPRPAGGLQTEPISPPSSTERFRPDTKTPPPRTHTGLPQTVSSTAASIATSYHHGHATVSRSSGALPMGSHSQIHPLSAIAAAGGGISLASSSSSATVAATHPHPHQPPQPHQSIANATVSPHNKRHSNSPAARQAAQQSPAATQHASTSPGSAHALPTSSVSSMSAKLPATSPLASTSSLSASHQTITSLLKKPNNPVYTSENSISISPAQATSNQQASHIQPGSNTLVASSRTRTNSGGSCGVASNNPDMNNVDKYVRNKIAEVLQNTPSEETKAYSESQWIKERNGSYQSHHLQKTTSAGHHSQHADDPRVLVSDPRQQRSPRGSLDEQHRPGSAHTPDRGGGGGASGGHHLPHPQHQRTGSGGSSDYRDYTHSPRSYIMDHQSGGSGKASGATTTNMSPAQGGHSTVASTSGSPGVSKSYLQTVGAPAPAGAVNTSVSGKHDMEYNAVAYNQHIQHQYRAAAAAAAAVGQSPNLLLSAAAVKQQGVPVPPPNGPQSAGAPPAMSPKASSSPMSVVGGVSVAGGGGSVLPPPPLMQAQPAPVMNHAVSPASLPPPPTHPQPAPTHIARAAHEPPPLLNDKYEDLSDDDS